MQNQNKVILFLLVSIIFAFIITGILIDGLKNSFFKFFQIQTLPSRLINDFIAVKGIGAALINAGFVGAIGLCLILIAKIQLSGPTFAAIFTLIGFALFGKTPLNILPIFFGVFLSAKFVGKNFREYILIALFGSSLGPLISFIAFESGLLGVWALITASLTGILIGFLLPSIAISMLHLHQGYNLYNIGLSCGFLGIFAAAIIKALGHNLDSFLNWHQQKSQVLILLTPTVSVVFIITAFITNGKKAIRDCIALQKYSGRLPSDFMDMESLSGSLLNSGIIGLLGSLYVYFTGGDFNGPVIGGLLTVMGFSTFGINLRNSWPVVIGVTVSSLLFKTPLDNNGSILAVIFGTTLAPLAGQFGIIIGFIAGFLHFTLVQQTSIWVGGINLYNNGFSGGLTATFIVSFLQWYKAGKTDFNR